MERVFALREGEVRALSLPMTAAVPSASARDAVVPPSGNSGHMPPQRLWGIVALGAGGVGLAVGVAEGLRAVDKKSALDRACPGGRCPRTSREDLDAFRSARTISTVGYGVGIACVAAGAVLVITAPRARSTGEGTHLWIAGTTGGIGGAFQ